MNVLGTILALTLALGAQATTKPNFSGEWKMNATKSDFEQLPPPSFMTRTITHAEPSLTIIEQQRSDMGDRSATRKYVTDGTETTFTVNGAEVKSAASCDLALTVVFDRQ